MYTEYKLVDFDLYDKSNTICCNFWFQNFVKTMTEKLTNQQREYEAQQMHRQHLQVRPQVITCYTVW